MLHRELALWEFIKEKLTDDFSCVLLLVINHVGSSPGRRGFKMVVCSDGSLYGSIGGGIMEHKLVAHVRKQLQDQSVIVVDLLHQIHQSEAPKNRSGMICSGEQHIAVLPLSKNDATDIGAIIKTLKSFTLGYLEANPEGLRMVTEKSKLAFNLTSEAWHYCERLGFKHHLHIVGGGHISLALSKVMIDLNFNIHVYDDREELNTLEMNSYAHHQHQVRYSEIDKMIPQGNDQFVVIMTFGYRSDTEVLKALLNKRFAYLGLLGSRAKISKLFDSLLSEGIDPKGLDQIDAPAGIDISSQTTTEIAISIAAQIIKYRRLLDTGSL